MQTNKIATFSKSAALIALSSSAIAMPLGCAGSKSSVGLQNAINLPVPPQVETLPSEERLSSENHDVVYEISARILIPLAFRLQPNIKSSFQRFKSEEARYDFFVSSNDSLTPRLRIANEIRESRADETVNRDRSHTVELGVEKRFFDTTLLDAAFGYRTLETDNDIGNHPFVSMNVRYPIGQSRERLERSSEDIFRRNELDDAQLAYIQRVRRELQSALRRFSQVIELQERVGHNTSWRLDLEALHVQMDTIKGRSLDTDRRRLEAEISSVTAAIGQVAGRLRVDTARLKDACGLPFFADLEIIDEPFNPFVGFSHQELLRVSIETDPEIATLRNAMKNAEVQLDLAREGRWDVALLFAGQSSLEGRSRDQGISDWSASVGVDISAVDPRVTTSLIRQAQANIRRFGQAVTARENTIFVDTLEPLVRIDTLTASRNELVENLSLFNDDYQSGIAGYIEGSLNIDDLLTRRETLFDQHRQISNLKFIISVNVAELCSATGKFFELLEVQTTGG